MKKKVFLSVFLPIIVIILALVAVPFVQAYTIDEGLVLTAQDIDNARIGAFELDVADDLPVDAKGLTDAKASLRLFGIIPIRTINVKVLTDTSVCAGGNLLGFDLDAGGVEILGFNSVLTRDGEKNPIKDIGLKKGDLIISLDKVAVSSLEDIDRILNGDKKGDEIQLEYIRQGKTYTALVIPQKDMLSGKYKLGLWVKNSTNGIGTLTYVKADGRFGAVGHAITDGNAPLSKSQTGDVYNAKFLGATKGARNSPGEVKASIEWSKGSIGKVDTNSQYGIFGELKTKTTNEPIELGSRFAVKPGKAYIRTQADGTGVKDYEIKIIKAVKQKRASEKSIVFKVVDKNLLTLTNGIVQGMSGSPIIQDGRLVGSVTHVFLNDSTKGYGVYIDWMLEQ